MTDRPIITPLPRGSKETAALGVQIERDTLWSQAATFDDPHARRSDPNSSHVAVAAIAADAKLPEQIRYAARRLHPALFDDTDLHELVEEQTGRRQQRNVIARSRGLMENDGLFVRVGERDRGNRKTVHYRLPFRDEVTDRLERELLGTMPKPPKYQPIEQWMWCATHSSIMNPEMEVCEHVYNDLPLDEQLDADPCELTPLYVLK